MYPLSTLLGRNKSSMQGTQSICGLHSTLCGIHRQDWQGLREGGASRVLSMISKFKGLEEKGTCCAKYPLNTRNGIRAVDRNSDLLIDEYAKKAREVNWEYGGTPMPPLQPRGTPAPPRVKGWCFGAWGMLVSMSMNLFNKWQVPGWKSPTTRLTFLGHQSQ